MKSSRLKDIGMILSCMVMLLGSMFATTNKCSASGFATAESQNHIPVPVVGQVPRVFSKRVRRCVKRMNLHLLLMAIKLRKLFVAVRELVPFRPFKEEGSILLTLILPVVGYLRLFQKT